MSLKYMPLVLLYISAQEKLCNLLTSQISAFVDHLYNNARREAKRFISNRHLKILKHSAVLPDWIR